MCIKSIFTINFKKLLINEVKFSRYRLSVSQKVSRGIALLFHDRGTRRGLVVSSTPRPHFTSGKDPVPRAGLDVRKISSPLGFDPGPSNP